MSEGYHTKSRDIRGRMELKSSVAPTPFPFAEAIKDTQPASKDASITAALLRQHCCEKM